MALTSYVSKFKAASIVLGGLATAAVTLRLLQYWPWRSGAGPKHKSHRIRDKLPRDLDTWRVLDAVEESIAVWEAVRPVLHEAGVYLWPSNGMKSRADPHQTIRSNGFAYVTAVRGEVWSQRFQRFSCLNELTRGGTTLCGSNVVIRVVVIGDEGKRHLDILRKLARGTKSLMTENHIVPLWNEAYFEDIVFAISPYIGNNLEDCYGFWPNNSVGDIMDMIIQALEAIVFVHDLGIVHRDLCKSNYLVQWHPESLSTMRVPLSRPRVFLTDFETAYEFPPELAQEQRTLCGPPREGYRRPLPPEVTKENPYDPFKADVWQLAESFSDFRTTVPELDAVLEQMYAPDVSARLSAMEARDRLATVVNNMAPIALLIPPELLNPYLLAPTIGLRT